MSAGPIKRERDQWKRDRVSTTDAARVCFKSRLAAKAHCGRAPKVSFDDWQKVTCADCRAALEADLQASTALGEGESRG